MPLDSNPVIERDLTYEKFLFLCGSECRDAAGKIFNKYWKVCNIRNI